MSKPVFQLGRFWKKAGYTPVYLRQTPVSNKWAFFSGFVCCAFVTRCNFCCVWLYLEWPDRRAFLCDAEGAEYRWSPGAEPVAVCLLERWTCTTFSVPPPQHLDYDTYYSNLLPVWTVSFCFPQISVGASCLSSPTSSAASIRAWRSTSCRIRSPRRRRAVRLLPHRSNQITPAPHRPELVCLWSLQFSVALSWQPISALTTSNVWSCTRGAWWTITSSWTWSQRWHACFSWSSSETCLCQPHSV